MDAIELLTSQHRDVERLFAECEYAEGAGAEKEWSFRMLANALAAHMTIEEQIFYPASKDARTEEALREAVEEHLSIKRLLADMLASDIEDEQFDARLTVLKEQVDHHVQEEEDQLFVNVKTVLDEERLEELGGMMESLYALMMEGEPSAMVPGETDAPAPI